MPDNLLTRRIELSSIATLALIDIVAGAIWIGIAFRTWWLGVPTLAAILMALSAAMIVAGALLFTRAPGLYLLALAVNLMMAIRMSLESVDRIHGHLYGGFIPGYWVPITHTVLSIGQTLLFLLVAGRLWLLYRARRREIAAAAEDDLSTPEGWDQGR